MQEIQVSVLIMKASAGDLRLITVTDEDAWLNCIWGPRQPRPETRLFGSGA